ncbi:DEAD/DEAH box helicase [Gelidibacter japonicus]|uniref:DEAD/DEAH box helicase n=1 Tax=Gelidibacter japonicus TaxID=1962232 RepID=UPI0013D0A17B|nr:DEAD/DEAH box helicase [Gelidibacter japonicus]
MVSEFKKHIQHNSAAIIRSRAKSIDLELTSERDHSYVFSYEGSGWEPYTIKVSYKDSKVRTSCSCPYDYVGLCKHEVAALYFLIYRDLKVVASTDLFGNVISDERKNDQPAGAIARETHVNQIVLLNHQLTKGLIDSIRIKNNLHNFRGYFVDITAIETDVVKTKYSDWTKSFQEFKYNRETSTLTATCSCKESKKKWCDHILSALIRIEEHFGQDFFNPRYVDNQKALFLKDYGLTLTDDYQKYFDFSFDIQGLKITEKIKNLVPSLKSATENLLPKFSANETDGLLIPKKAKITEFTHGIGFCFEIYENAGIDYFNYLVFKAKYKKHSTTFVSSYKQIDPFYFMTQLKNIPESNHLLVIKALGFSEVHDAFFHEFSLDTFRNAFIQFNELLDETSTYPYYIKKESESLVKKNLSPLAFSDDYAILSFDLIENKDVFTLKPKITIADKSYKLTSSKIRIFPFFCLHEHTVYRFKTPNEYVYINRLNMRNEINFIKTDSDHLYTEVLKPLSQHFEINSKVYKHAKNQTADDQLKRQVYLSDYEGEYILFKLGVQYNDTLVLLHTKEQLYDEKTQRIQMRNDTFENEFIEEFKELHPEFQEQDGVFFLTPYQLIEDQWLLKASQKMEQMGIAIFGAKQLKSFKYNLNKPTMTMSVNANTDWFDLALEIKFGNEKVSLKDLKKAIINKSKYVVLSDGTLGVLPKEWLQKFTNYFKVGEVGNNAIKISNYQFNIIDELYESIESTPAFLLELQRKKKQLQNLKNLADIILPKQLKATLRPYQKEGLNWLAFLHENKLGGCLADDMGLGKTIQVIAFFAYLKFVRKEKDTHLVVAPTSLIFNWENEVSKFCPSLKTLIYTGANRSEKRKDFKKSDIVLTTYGTILNDIEILTDLNFGYTVLDESQAIKNPNSKRYKAVRMLKSKNRLALTGTPIENNTFDLYAQMNFLNPGLLGAMSHFKNEFADAIDKVKSEETSQLLSKMIHPFLLRRTKKQVATELPEKTESIIYCEMGAEQRKVYNYFKDKYRDYLLNKIDENGAAKSQMYVLEGLTKLRQICNSPELLSDAEDYGKSSVKLDVLIDHIKTKTTQHKVLVFSQFTSMLQLIKDRLDNENIDYEYLDGKTQKREDKVSNFQDTDALRVFLISLKAGGVGLNLTAADYVFLVDPWWNPAVENQAIDRSYRIGQTKHVMAYKMICKDTIEEKIINLQKSKKSVSDAVIQVDRGKKSFDAQEIQALFS